MVSDARPGYGPQHCPWWKQEPWMSIQSQTTAGPQTQTRPSATFLAWTLPWSQVQHRLINWYSSVVLGGSADLPDCHDPWGTHSSDTDMFVDGGPVSGCLQGPQRSTDIKTDSHRCVRTTAHIMVLGSSPCPDITVDLGSKQVIPISPFLIVFAP